MRTWAGAGKVRPTLSVAERRPRARFRSALPAALSLSLIFTVDSAATEKRALARTLIRGGRVFDERVRAVSSMRPLLAWLPTQDTRTRLQPLRRTWIALPAIRHSAVSFRRSAPGAMPAAINRTSPAVSP
jgi:hypothetical protein